MKPHLSTYAIARILAIVVVLARVAAAEIPAVLKHTIPAPLKAQGDEYFGSSVAVDGNYIVVGVPNDNDDVGVAKVFSASTGALLHVLPHPKPNSGDEFGYSVAISGSMVVVGAPRDDDDETGRVFVFDLARANPSLPVFTIKNPSPGEDDDFGASVAIDGMRLVVGTPWDDVLPFYRSGSAYVYDLDGATPTVPVTVLNNPNPYFDVFFGCSVAISGSRVVIGTRVGYARVYNLAGPTPAVPTMTLSGGSTFGALVAIAGTVVVIGDAQASTFPPGPGAAVVYNIASAVPAKIATLGSPTPSSGESFGYSVAISGMLVVVGSTREADGGIYPGSAFIYNVAKPNPIPIVTIKNPTPANNDYFGYSVAISGTRVVIGAPQDDTDAEDLGSAYVYNLASPTPTVPKSTLHSPGPPSGMEFGSAVAISGTRAVVGAPLDDAPWRDSGRVHIYDLASAIPIKPVATINNPTPGSSDQFGSAVAIAGNRVAVGAPFDMIGTLVAGKVYVFDLNGTAPTVIAALNNPTPKDSDYFGTSVAISGSILVVGASQDDSGGPSTGSAYVYNLAAANPSIPSVVLINPDPGTTINFGHSVAIAGRYVVVGAPAFSMSEKVDRAYVYDLESGTPAVPLLRLIKPILTYYHRFGSCVSISGARIAVSAPWDDTGEGNSGKIYVYDLTTAAPAEPVLTINNLGESSFNDFGSALAISGTRLIVGARNPSSTFGGSAYIFDLSSATPTVPVAVHDDPGHGNNLFGSSVAIDGDFALVGAPWADSSHTGLAYVFGPSVPGGTSGPIDEDGDGLLDSWERLFFGTIVGHSALDDTDGDGLCELLEMAFDRHPLWPETVSAPETVIYEGYLTTVILKRPGVTYLAQSAATLDDAAFSAATTTVLLDSETTLVVRDNVHVSTPGSRFMRVKVTSAP